MSQERDNFKSDSVAAESETPDGVTILFAKVAVAKVLTKHHDTWVKSQPKTHAKHFDVTTRAVASLRSLLRALRNRGPKAVLIQGAPKAGLENAIDLERISSNFDEVSHSYMILDIDALETTTADATECARIAIARLPAEFHDAACIVQLTSGHAIANDGDEPGAVNARLRLFFWLDRKISLAEMNAWAFSFDLPVDRSIYRRVQPIYIAGPIIINNGKIDQKADPVKERWHMIEGADCVFVPVDLHAITKATETRGLEAADHVEFDTPHMIEDAIQVLKERNEDRINNDHRRTSMLNAGYDLRDRALTEETATAMAKLWFDPSDERADDLKECFGDFMDEAKAKKLVNRLKLVGEDAQAAFENGEPLDESEVDRMIGDAYKGGRNAPGCKFKTMEEWQAKRDVYAIPSPVEAFEVFKLAIASGSDSVEQVETVVTAMRNDDMPAEKIDAVRFHLLNALDFAVFDIADAGPDIVKAGRAIRGEPDEKPKRVSRTISLKELLSQGPFVPVWLVKGFLPQNVSCLLYGLPGSLKTTGIASVGFSMATQTPWIDGTTLPYGGFLFAAMESADHTGNMFLGLSMQHLAELDSDKNYPLRIHSEPLPLYEKAGRETPNERKIIKLALAFERDFGVPCRLIVLDTLSRIMVGGNESMPADVGILSAAVERIREATGATVVVLHHPTKDGKDMRGSGALTGNFEGVLRAERKGDNGKIVVERLKGVKSGASIDYRSKSVGIGSYEDGSTLSTFVLVKPEPSKALEAVEDPDVIEDPPELTAPAGDALAGLSDRNARVLDIARGFSRPFTRGELHEAYNARFGKKQGSIGDDTALRALKSMFGSYLRMTETRNRADRKWYVIAPETEAADAPAA